jgi:hypothetical protein
VSKTATEGRYMMLVRSLGCVICKRFEPTGLPVELHHVAEGSGLRNNYAVAPLCGDQFDGGHHRGPIGLHGLGTKAFIRIYRPPGDSEYGLLVWTAEDLARHMFLQRRAA